MVNSRNKSDRSPARLAELALLRSSYQAIRHLTCSFDSGVLTLVGRLPSYYQKQIASKAVQKIDGVERVELRIEVTTTPRAPIERPPVAETRPATDDASLAPEASDMGAGDR